jgi:hypothetical protein
MSNQTFGNNQNPNQRNDKTNADKQTNYNPKKSSNKSNPNSNTANTNNQQNDRNNRA